MKRPPAPLAALAVMLLAGPPLLAQSDRYHVGLRLRAFEVAWEDQRDPTARRRALPPLQAATASFFRFQLGEVARNLDRARHALRSPDEPTAAVAWAESLALRPSARLVDLAARKIDFRLAALYKVDRKTPKEAQLRLTLLDRTGQPALPAAIFPITELPLSGSLAFKDMTEADYSLRVEVWTDDQSRASHRQGLALVRQPAARLEALARGLDTPAAVTPRTDRETARMLHRLLKGLLDGNTQETDYPAARLLAEAEAVVQGKSPYGDRKTGQFWLTLATPQGDRAVVRLLAPTAAARGEKRPLVIALHGAGGSENLFFDGYGRGGIVGQCEKRGWLLIAPRYAGGGTPMADIIDAVDRLYPGDRRKVFLVGHSMGAGQALTLASQAPERYAGVAALGGGGRVRPSEGMKTLPFYVGVGKEDFALTGARGLRRSLEEAGLKTFLYRELADVEHMVIVQEALPELFACFDKAPGR